MEMTPSRVKGTTPNKENIRKWVDALRSGDYEQGQGKLHRSDADTYCCLGVACKIAADEGAIADLPWSVSTGSIHYNNATLPGGVRDWLGLEDGDPVPSEDACDCGDRQDCWQFHERYATAVNDEDGLTFDQIADLIEKRYLTNAPA